MIDVGAVCPLSVGAGTEHDEETGSDVRIGTGAVRRDGRPRDRRSDGTLLTCVPASLDVPPRGEGRRS